MHSALQFLYYLIAESRGFLWIPDFSAAPLWVTPSGEKFVFHTSLKKTLPNYEGIKSSIIVSSF